MVLKFERCEHRDDTSIVEGDQEGKQQDKPQQKANKKQNPSTVKFIDGARVFTIHQRPQ